jgi:hypothetical protein
VPGAQFIAHGAIDPDGRKPEGFVEPHAGGVRERDAGVGVVIPLEGKQRHERTV